MALIELKDILLGYILEFFIFKVEVKVFIEFDNRKLKLIVVFIYILDKPSSSS